MPRDQIVMGAVIAALCLAGFFQARWFVVETNKGRRLAERCGATRAVWILRALFGAGALFGVLLATNLVRPVQW